MGSVDIGVFSSDILSRGSFNFYSNVIHRDDQDLEDEINKLNKKLENLCRGKGMRFIDNSNIKSSLNRSKLHLNKSGTAFLTKNFAKIVNSD